MKHCSRCKTFKPPTSEFFARTKKNKDGLDFWCLACKRSWRKENETVWRKSYREAGARYRAKLRSLMIEAYGSKCVCCGETELDFLTLEHIGGGGNKHRKECNNQILVDLNKRGWPKEGFTLLCYNCNLSTRFGRICPHKRQIMIQVA
jgi:hypothetical protein